jgi:hypothetical protein
MSLGCAYYNIRKRGRESEKREREREGRGRGRAKTREEKSTNERPRLSHVAGHHPIHQDDEMRVKERPADLRDEGVHGPDLVLGTSRVFVDHRCGKLSGEVDPTGRFE